MSDVIKISSDLIMCKSVTPQDGGSIGYISEFLSHLGFKCHNIDFGDTKNLYAKFDSGSETKNICFVGHVDVVSPGDISTWSHDPFISTIKDGKLYGRGASDMKCAIACFLVAVKDFLDKKSNISLSVLITSDEEGSGKNGVILVLPELSKRGEKIDYCIVGEPTSVERVGDMIKVGRRGSFTARIEVVGEQGHVAYPHLAENPIPILSRILCDLNDYKLDSGNEVFESSNLEIVDINTGNNTYNLIPRSAKAVVNIRHNDMHDKDSLYNMIHNICKKYSDQVLIDIISHSDTYLAKSFEFANVVSVVIEKICQYKTILSTNGGTSDARFVSRYCDNIVEVGLSSATAHKVDEHVLISDISILQSIYLGVLNRMNATNH